MIHHDTIVYDDDNDNDNDDDDSNAHLFSDKNLNLSFHGNSAIVCGSPSSKAHSRAKQCIPTNLRASFNCGLWLECFLCSNNYKLALNFEPVRIQISSGLIRLNFTSAKIHAWCILEIFLTAISAARLRCHKLTQ